MDVWCVYAFILCLCCPVFRERHCDGLITRPRSPTVCVELITELNKRPGPWMVWKSRCEKCKIIWGTYFLGTNAHELGFIFPLVESKQSLTKKLFILDTIKTKCSSCEVLQRGQNTIPPRHVRLESRPGLCISWRVSQVLFSLSGQIYG
jgi:hypothetical protein